MLNYPDRIYVRETSGGSVLFHPETMYSIFEVFPGSHDALRAKTFVIFDTAAESGGVPRMEAGYILPFDDAESVAFPETTTPTLLIFSATCFSLQVTNDYSFCCNFL